jgi:integrase
MNGSRFWWYRWTGPEGKRIAVSLKTDDEAEAIKRARSVAVDKLSSSTTTKRSIPIVDRYVNEAQARTKKPMRPETAKNVRYILTKYLTDQGIEQLSGINTDSLNRWLGKYSGETVFSYASIVTTFGRWLHKKGLVAYYSLEGFERPTRPPKGRSNWVRKGEVQKLIDGAPDDDMKFILYCGFHAGLRRSEISWARVDWFDLEHNLVQVCSDPESGVLLKDENRPVPLTTQFAAFLKTYLAGKTGFVLAPEKLEKGHAKYRFDFRSAFETYVDGKCTIHDMRRSFASNRVSDGVSVYKVARWLGDGVAVVERSYGHLAPADEDINIGV